MAKSLKEALLEQMAALQERGLAPGEIPVEQEEDVSYASYDDEAERRFSGLERDSDSRRRGGGRLQRATKNRPMRSRERDGREAPRRERREGRGETRENPEALAELLGPAPLPSRPPRIDRPMGPRPPMPPGGPRPGPGFGPRPAPRADMLRRNAERIQRDQADRAEIQQLLSSYGAQEVDDEAVREFFAKLEVETGALPPLNVVVIALRNAGTADAAEVGNQVRLHNRRARGRPAGSPPPTPVAAG